MYRLSISNIAWTSEHDQDIYFAMRDLGFTGLEIAPTRIFSMNPYDYIDEARAWSEKLFEEYGLIISSVQSIWYGRSESIFGSDGERKILMDYTKQTIRFAEAVGCKNLVFGCPKNRAISEGINDDAAVKFFKTIGDYAYDHNTVIGMEANPIIYNTNYINTTKEAMELIASVDSPGFRLNLDVGTMIYNDEDVSIIEDAVEFINHVHISEPGLTVIQKRKIHKELRNLLSGNYDNFISIEMSKDAGIEMVKQSIDYVSEIFL